MIQEKNVELAPARSEEEVVGALLPPSSLPTAVPASDRTGTDADAAVPLSTFLYDHDTIQHDTSAEIPSAPPEEDFPTAPLLPQYEDMSSRERKEAIAARRGKQMGRILAEAELEDIRRAARDIRAINYYATEGVREANDVARLRNQSGIQVKKDKYYKPELRKPEATSDPDMAPYALSGGYEVAEYETSQYDTSDYEVSEFKSVYEK